MENRESVFQAKLFVDYLISKPASEQIVDRYQDAIDHSPQPINRYDEKLLAFIAKHGWSLRFIDAGLVFTNPHSEVRRRLYVMFAILESDPTYTKYFLPQKRSPFYIFLVGYAGAKAVLKAMVGIVLVRLLK